MAITYHVIKRPTPGIEGGGDGAFYASNVATGNADIDVLTRRIEKISTVSGSDIRAVLYALADIVPELLEDGFIVDIQDLGTFRISISSNGSENEEEVGPNNIRSSRILFRPAKKFKHMLNNLEYVRE